MPFCDECDDYTDELYQSADGDEVCEDCLVDVAEVEE